MRAAVGVDVGGTGTKAGIVTQKGEVLLRVERPTDPVAGTKGILAIVEEVLERAAEVDADVVAVGVGAAGFIDAAQGAVTFSPNLNYDDPQIASALRARASLPVAVDNDANAAAWGERAFGAARGSDHLVLVTLGTGIGSGIIVDGKLLRGYTGAAAELGHIVIDPSGPDCTCGLRGCLEQLASGTAIGRMAREELDAGEPSVLAERTGAGEAVTAVHVAAAAAEYDELARSVLKRAGNALGIGLANIVNIFDPELIVLGGSVVEAGESYLGPARDRLSEMMSAQRRRPVRLDVTALSGRAGIVGAAALAFDEAK